MTTASDVLVHIGWPKTGTTWLQEQFFVEAHGYAQLMSRDRTIRELVLPDQIGFDPALLREALTDESRGVTQRGLYPVISHERLAGVFHNRLESVVLGERLIQSVPDMRVLIVVREQRNAMLAAWQQYVRNGGAPDSGPSVRSLTDYYGNDQTRASVLPPPGDLKYFQYDRLISWFSERLGVERVLVLPLEMLRSEPAAFQQRINRFTHGVESPTLAGAQAVNKAWAPVTYGLKRRLNYVGDRKRVSHSQRSPYQLAMAASYKFDSALPSAVRRVGEEKQRRLVGVLAGRNFAASNRKLATMVDWNPQEYGYMV